VVSARKYGDIQAGGDMEERGLIEAKELILSGGEG